MTYKHCITYIDMHFTRMAQLANADQKRANRKQNLKEAHVFLSKIYFHLIDYFMHNFKDEWTAEHGDVDSELGDAMDIAQFALYDDSKCVPKAYRNQWVTADNWYSYYKDTHVSLMSIPTNCVHIATLQDVVDVCKYLDAPFKEELNQTAEKSA